MLTFPTGLFVPSTLTPELVGASVSGGQSLSGLTQAAMTSGGGYWQIDFGEAVLWTPSKLKTWRAVSSRADGGATPFIVPLCDRIHQAFLAADVQRGAGVGNSDDSTFSDGALWPAEYITATLTGSAALRATWINLTISGSAGLNGGEFFTIWGVKYGQRLYNITQVVPLGGNDYQCEIRPPLREAAANGATLDFDNPRCQMQIVGPSGAILEQLRFGRSPKIRFIENFTPVGS